METELDQLLLLLGTIRRWSPMRPARSEALCQAVGLKERRAADDAVRANGGLSQNEPGEGKEESGNRDSMAFSIEQRNER